MSAPRPWFVVINTVMLWVTTGIASAVLWPVYEAQAFMTLVVVTTVVGSAIAVLGAVFRWSTAVVVLVTLAGFLVIGVPLAVPDRALLGVLPTIDGVIHLLSGVALGWKQLLTIVLPVGNYQDLLVPALVLVLATVVGGLTVALRSRAGELAALFPVALFVVGIAVGPEVATLPIHLSLSLMGAILVWLVWWGWDRRRQAILALSVSAQTPPHASSGRRADHRVLGLRTIVSAVMIMALAGASGIAASALIPPAGTRQVLRTAIEQPFDPREYVSPLAGFRRFLQSGKADSVVMTVTGLPEGARIRIATLDSYDGIVYSVGSAALNSDSGTFTRVPYRFEAAGAGDRARITVSLGDYDGVWLPTVGTLGGITFSGDRLTGLRDAFRYNNVSHTAAVIGGVSAGDSYVMDSTLSPQPTLAQLAALSPGGAQVPRVTVLPAELELALERYTTGAEGEGNRLVSMLDGLRSNGYISHGISDAEPPSRSGHSSERISQFLTDQRMIGDAEQYAVTAALMATEIGFPTRVVFGFDPYRSARLSGQAISSEEPISITGDAVSAWIEVNTEQYGWVSIDPTPAAREIPEEEPESPTLVARPQTVVPPPVEEPKSSDNVVPLESVQDQPKSPDEWLVVLSTVLRVVGWAALVLGILVAPFVVIIIAKFRRRALRRGAAAPLDRISGGWHEFEDVVADHGYAAPPAATRRELAHSVGGAQSSVLAVLSDRAVFSPGEPSDDEADAVWNAVEQLTAALGAGRTRWQWLRARVSVRSLGAGKPASRATGERGAR